MDEESIRELSQEVIKFYDYKDNKKEFKRVQSFVKKYASFTPAALKIEISRYREDLEYEFKFVKEITMLLFAFMIGAQVSEDVFNTQNFFYIIFTLMVAIMMYRVFVGFISMLVNSREGSLRHLSKKMKVDVLLHLYNHKIGKGGD